MLRRSYCMNKLSASPKNNNTSEQLIELYLSLEEDCYFTKGFYYDADKKVHGLRAHAHVGTIQDSVLIYIEGNNQLSGCVCRYFPRGKVEFYNTRYGQQGSWIPMLIHNTGKEELVVSFNRGTHRWIIPPGKSEYINLIDRDKKIDNYTHN